MEGLSCYQLPLQVMRLLCHQVGYSYVHYSSFRANIESFCGSQVDQLRKEYTQEDKELIEEYLEAKESCCLKPEHPDQKLDSSPAQKFLLKEEFEEGIDG